MTRKDFELIAGVLYDTHYESSISGSDHEVINLVAKRFADRLATTNGAFDRDRFLGATGLQEVK